MNGFTQLDTEDFNHIGLTNIDTKLKTLAEYRPVPRLRAGGGSFYGRGGPPRGVWGHAPPALKNFKTLFLVRDASGGIWR